MKYNITIRLLKGDYIIEAKSENEAIKKAIDQIKNNIEIYVGV
jgi:hypothetical protein